MAGFKRRVSTRRHAMRGFKCSLSTGWRACSPGCELAIPTTDGPAASETRGSCIAWESGGGG